MRGDVRASSRLAGPAPPDELAVREPESYLGILLFSLPSVYWLHRITPLTVSSEPKSKTFSLTADAPRRVGLLALLPA